jgi:geranyl-CoA carboxylase alpha subunit
MHIGGTHAGESYLRTDKIIDAARACGAQAVHPGYGFLSENAGFAQLVMEAGLVWIGPPPDAMRAMGDKASARRRMSAAGVPVLPGYDGEDQQPAVLHREAQRIGLPLMVKASAGGGGRGMRLVTQADRLDAALQAARAEAQAAFGDPRLLLERALRAPRHVEIQVFADTHGQVLHLGERDCSVQRRHQKIIEEAPSPAVSPALRRRMGEVAIQIAREVGYVGAGTVEFLLDEHGDFWFMEMNTRLQVEHPLTEALVGVDLVEWQLCVARGEALPLDQASALARYEQGGHAIEVRLCAEDPVQDLGCDISPYYDSMLGKLIAHARSRTGAIAQLANALDETVCLGLRTNRAFLARVLRDAAFAGDGVTTAFLAERFVDPASRDTPAPDWLEALAAVATVALPTRPLPALWSAWCSSGFVGTDAVLGRGADTRRWRVQGRPDELTAECGSTRHRISRMALHDEDRLRAIIDGRPVQARFVRVANRWCWLAAGAELDVNDLRLAGASGKAGAAPGALQAPMHGRITQVLSAPGTAVEAGSLLLVMEAMKMEHRIHSPRAGTVKAVHVCLGEQVRVRQLLAELEP